MPAGKMIGTRHTVPCPWRHPGEKEGEHGVRAPAMSASRPSRSGARMSERRYELGSVAKVRQPRLAPASMTVSEFRDGRSFAWSTGNRLLATVGDHRIEPVAQGSHVTLALRQQGPLAGIVGALYEGLIRRYIRMEAEGLKHASESRG